MSRKKRGGRVIWTLHQTGRLSGVLRELWSQTHEDPIRAEERRGLLLFILLGLLAASGSFCYLEKTTTDFPWCILAGLTILVAIPCAVVAFGRNSADEFYERLKAAAEIWRLGYFQIARLTLAELQEKSLAAILEEGAVVTQLEAELNGGGVTKGLDEYVELHLAHTEHERMVAKREEIFGALGLVRETHQNLIEQARQKTHDPKAYLGIQLTCLHPS